MNVCVCVYLLGLSVAFLIFSTTCLIDILELCNRITLKIGISGKYFLLSTVMEI